EDQFEAHGREYHSKSCRVKVRNEQGDEEPIGLRRTEGCFICPVCQKPIQTRSRTIKHVKRHLTEVTNASKFECPDCNETFESKHDLEKRTKTHFQLYEVLAMRDAGKNSEELSKARSEINTAIRNPIITNCLLEVMVPFSLSHKSGSTSTALLIPAGAKRAVLDPIASGKSIKQPKKSDYTDPGDTSFILSTHQYGGVIQIADYRPLKPEFFFSNCNRSESDIAKQLAGAVIQTGLQATLIIKAEVYDRDSVEDPHGFDLVKPVLEAKKVSMINHGNSNKLIIGARTWSALITASVELSTGSIDVGVSNSSPYPASSSIVWGRHND
ncbi:hypothetical protein BGZ46_000991, partial [Entomortierella lignicola]